MGILPKEDSMSIARLKDGMLNRARPQTGIITEAERLENLRRAKADAERKEAVEATKEMLSQHYEKAAKFDKEFMETQHEFGKMRQGNADLNTNTLTEMDLLNPSTMPEDAMQVNEPSIFNGKLKSYQRKGLNWLANLYEQGINGILADEMGLGKTIQSIAFMAHLAEVKGIWGPFLVIAPNSTLHQWKNEISKFCPTLKVLPYWGTQKERKIIRKYWKPELLYKEDAEFHILITSYHVVVADDKYFGRLKWHYMLLDEAQAIKNSHSLRWKSLLNLKCRNRLLLTGTPIQNSMAELWALLHFIMPDFFDSHEEFNEWFSKDIQGHAQGDKKTLDAHQLQRLHMILKPFMLRRVKKDVEHEMAPKIEIQVNCPLSVRQRKLYDALKNKISMKDLLSNTENLMNIVMQFRKVCNHPEIFERRSVEQPYCFINPQSFLHKYDFEQLTIQAETYKYGSNPISFYWPKLLDLGLRLYAPGHGGRRVTLAQRKFNIFHMHYIYTTMMKRKNSPSFSDMSRCESSCFSFTRFMDLSPAECSFVALSNELGRWLASLAERRRHSHLKHFLTFSQNETRKSRHSHYRGNSILRSLFVIAPLRCGMLQAKPNIVENVPNHTVSAVESQKEKVVQVCELPPLVLSHTDRIRRVVKVISQTLCCCTKAAAPPPVPLVPGFSFSRWYQYVFHHPVVKEVLIGARTVTECQMYMPFSFGVSLNREQRPSFSSRLSVKPSFHMSDMYLESLCRPVHEAIGSNTADARVPNFGKLLSDSGKLSTLDTLLRRLRAGGHRVLIFSQMTKMIDILEDYMRFRKIKFFRLDGQTSLADRRDMVREFQTNPSYFVFLLSTRAGGLGINLTAADTVIFYDNDWNPTMDAQAMDRVHRIGQTKQVTVYRLVCKNTVEERILKRAQVKHTIQKTVYAGGFKMQGGDSLREISSIFKANELRELVLGDEVKDQLLEERRKKEEKQKQIEEDRRQKKVREKAEKKRIKEEKERIKAQKMIEKQKEKDRKAKARKEQKEKARQDKQLKNVVGVQRQ